MNQNERKTVLHRMLLLIAVACVIMGLYAMRLIFLQLVNGDDFKAKATNTTDYNFTVTAARGDIVDSAGRRIATTATSYNVVLNKLLMGDRDLDAMLQQIVELLRENGESWNDTLLIGQPDAAGRYAFTDDDSSASDQKQLADMKETLGLQQYATANDVMEMLVEKNELQGFPLEWQRVLAGIHYEMDRQAFSNVNNFVMAENVSAATVATIKEHSLQLPGVEIVETSARSYDQSDIIPAVLGRVGKITAEKWKVTDSNGQVTYPLREKGYNMNDVLGISGLESVYEDELRGKDGVETITRNSDGVIVDTKLTTVPEPGHTVQLTIDSNFQRAVDKALADNIDMINRVYNTGTMKAAAGAVVVLDVNVLYWTCKKEAAAFYKLGSKVPVFRYHDRWKSLGGGDFFSLPHYTAESPNRGYLMKTGREYSSRGDYMQDYPGRGRPGQGSLGYLRQIAQICAREQIPLVLCSVPSAANWNGSRHDAIAQIAQELGVPYVDGNLENMGIDWHTDSPDGGDHMNPRGAAKVTAWIGDYLRRSYALPDRREDPAYENWNRDAEDFRARVAAAE